MKKIIKLCVVSLFIIPVFSLSAVEKSEVGSQSSRMAQTILIAANDNAELQPAETEKADSMEKKGEETKAVEEKKDSKIGFIVGVAVMVIFMIIIIVKTKGIEK